MASRILCLVTLCAACACAQNATQAGKFHVQHPTLLNLGFEWPITGDANRNASVAVKYRKSGDAAWRAALPLVRIGGENVYRRRENLDYTVPHGFAGSILNLPLFIGLEPADALVGLKERGYRVVAAVPRAAVGYWEHPWVEDSVVLLGNEAWGLPEDDRELADDEVCVPVFGKAESLNVAVAAALIFYEIRRRHPLIKVSGRLRSDGKELGEASGSRDGRTGGGP